MISPNERSLSMPNKPTHKQLQEWYKKFSDILLKNADIDVNKPEALGLVKNFQITKWDATNVNAPDVKIEYAYLPQGGNEPVTPAPENPNSSEYQSWLRTTLKPAVTDEQILQLYNMSQAGTLMITSPEKGLRDIQMVRTDLSGKIILSQPISAYRNGGNEKLPEDNQIPQMPVKPASSLKPEDYNIPSRPTAPAEPANMHPGFWSWLGHMLGMDTDYTKLRRYELELSAYEEKAARWERDLDEKPSYTVTNEATSQTTEVAYDDYRLSRYEHEQFSQQLEVFKADPLGKFSAIANSAAKLADEKFWSHEQVAATANFNSTSRGKERIALNTVNKMLGFEERTDSLIHNWIGHDGVPSKVTEWNPNFRVDDLQLKPIDLPKAPGFDQMPADKQAAHIKDMTELFDLAALGSISHPDVIAKELKPGCTAQETAQIIFSPLLNDMFTSLRVNPTEYFKYIEPARTKALDAMKAYAQGNKAPLGELLGCAMRQILLDCALADGLTDCAVNDTYLVGKLYNILQDPELLKASGLKEEELQEARGNMELYQIMRQGLRAKKDILDHAFEKQTLSPEKLKQAAQDVLTCHSAMLGVYDGFKKNEAAAYASEECEKLSADLLNSNFSKMTGKARVQGDKVEASPYEIAKNRLNLIVSTLPANEFTLQLTDKNWVKQYTQTILEKANLSKVGDMSRAELRELFSKKDEEIFSSLMPSSKLEVPKQNAPVQQAQKQAEVGGPVVK